MGEFFNGWRRKAGLVTLAMALAVVGMWVRSSLVYDQCTWADSNHKNVVYSLNGEFGWLRWSTSRSQRLSFSSVPIDTEDESKWRLIHDMIRGMHDAREWMCAYWCLAIPLTLLSAWLILIKPRKVNLETPSSKPATHRSFRLSPPSNRA